MLDDRISVDNSGNTRILHRNHDPKKSRSDMYYLHGGAGVPNFGDELIIRQWLDFFKGKVTDPIIVSGMREKALLDIFQEKYPDPSYTSALCAYQSKLPSGFWSSFRAGLSFFKDGKTLRGDEHERLLQAKTFHLHGGGYINKIWPNHAFYLGLAAALKEKTGCRLVGTGLGLTPSPMPDPENASAFKDALMAFDALEVRDQASFEYILKTSGGLANVILGLDDVFLCRPSLQPGVKTLHISMHSQDWANEAANRLDPGFINSFERQIFWQCHYKDVNRYEQLKMEFPRLQKIEVAGLTHDPLPLGPDDFMITSRFHPHMQASRSGLRGQYVAPFQYSSTKHFSVLGLGSRFAPLPEVNLDGSYHMYAADHSRTLQKQEFWWAQIGHYLS